MKIFKFLLSTVVFLLSVSFSFAQPCSSGCTIIVSSETSVNYTIGTGEQLCITSTGIISGNITLNGGAICNQGLIQSPSFVINNGTIDNYGTISQSNVLELKNASILKNWSGGIIKVSQQLIVGNDASYLAERDAKFTVYPFPIMALIANAGSAQTICSSTSATLGGQPTAVGGTGPYTYSWAPSTGLDYTNIANPIAKPTSTTTYTLTVTDALGRIKASTVALTVIASPVANAGSAQTVCKGVTVNLGGSPSASGGTAPYKYKWTLYEGLNNDSIANPTANPNYTTTYVLTVVDNNKCYGTSSAVITVRPDLAVFAGKDTTILKRDTMLLGGYPTASYGTPPYTYSWSPNTALNSTTIANPKASPSSNTTYIVTVNDAGGCGSKKDTVVVAVDPNPKVFAGPDVKICRNDTVTLGKEPAAKGGTLPYTYSWSPSTGLASTSIANPNASPATTTSYTLTVTDGASVIRKDTVVVTVNAIPTVNAGSDINTSVSAVTLGGSPAATGGMPPYIYKWTPKNSATVDYVSNPYVIVEDTTTFTLTVIDSNGCKGVDAVIVNFNNIKGSSCNLDSCTWIVEGNSSTNYTIGSGQKLCINSGGKVTGTITLNSGGRICNSGTFQPASFTFNGGVITNNTTGNAKITGSMTVPSGGGIVNDGYFEITSTFQTNSGSSFLNKGNIVVQGTLPVKTASFTNYGSISLNSKSLTITSPGTLINEGTILGIDTLKNSSTLKMGDYGIIFTKHYYNYASAVTQKVTSGSSTYGEIVVCTRTENYGQINDSIDICDQSPSAGPVYLDVNSGTVQSSVRYCLNSTKIKGVSEVCGTCPTLTVTRTGCAGDIITFSAKSTKLFDTYEFFKNGVSVQKGEDANYTSTTPSVAGDVIMVTATSYSTPCKKITSDVTVPSKPTVSISGSTVANPSVTLTASGADTYKWTTTDGTVLSTTGALMITPDVTTTYILYGTLTNGCFNTASVEVSKPLQLNASTQNPSFTEGATGSISVNITGGKLPFTYLWSTGSTAPVLTSTSANTTYSVTITDANNQTANLSVTTGYAVSWGHSSGIITSGSDISKTAAGDAWGTAGTSSSTVIGNGQNGWLEFTYSSNTDTYSAGLGTSDNNGQADAIGYSYRVVQNGLFIYESGVQKAVFFGSGMPKVGDVLRIERIGSNINYKKNGVVYYTTAVSPSAVLVANTAIYNSGGIIKGIGGGFTDFPATEYHQIDELMIPTDPFPICNGDKKRNFVQTITYDLAGNKASEKKIYSDYLGRQIQTQTRSLTDNNVLTTQTLYDLYGRAVLNTLSAPIYQSDMCYKENFITNSSGASYSNADFNVPNYTKSPVILWSGEVDRPKGVGNATPNTLGWYYSNNNTDERFVPASAFPYKRIEYDDNNIGAIKRATLAGDAFVMGNGLEAHSYNVSTLNELDYLYGKNKCWIVENYSDPNYDGQGTITPAAITSDYRIYKSISIDQNGQEIVNFEDMQGEIVASCLSGQVNGSNVKTTAVSRIFTNAAYADIHLPKGCESSLLLNNGGTYTIFDLKKGTYVKFSNGSTQFTGTTPILPAGIYRITPLGGQQLSISQNVNYYNFSINYYDKAGRLSLKVPPEGIDPSYTPTTGSNPVHKMITSTNYNSIGSITSTITSEGGVTLYLYRNDGKIKFSQNAKQRASNSNAGLRKYSYFNYDAIGRVIETGEYDPTLSGGSPVYYFDKLLPGTSTPGAGYTAVSTILETGTLADRCTQQTFSAYDVSMSPPLGYTQNYLKNKISRTWNAASMSWYGYDELGRTIWYVQQIQDMPSVGNTTVKTINYKYNVNGSVSEVVFQKEVPAEDFYHYYEYDTDQRLKKVLTSSDAGQTKQELSSYYYYRHGALKRIELGNKTQGLDYIYTINGWLKSINNPELLSQKDPGKDGIPGGVGKLQADLFGMTLDYFAGDYLRANTQVQTYDTPWSIDTPPGPYYSRNLYNGTVKGLRWNTAIPSGAPTGINYTSNQLMYAYFYDEKYQLKTATFGVITNPGILNGEDYVPGNGSPMQQMYGYKGPIFAAKDDYKVSNISYDLNGNIKTLNRNGFAIVGVRNTDMDQLAYNYNTSGGRLINNRLKNVTDAITANVYNALEFKSGQTSGVDNYKYDQIGQQTEDNSSDPAFSDYDVYGRVTAVYSNSAKTNLKAKFTYDEKGTRLKKTDINGTDTWYINDASGVAVSVYEKTTGNAIQQKEVMLIGSKREGVHLVNSNIDVFELSDNTGNVRATYSTTINSNIKTYYDKEYKDDYLFNYNGSIDYTVNHTTSPANKTASVKINSQQPYGPVLKFSVKAGQTISGSFYFKTSGTGPLDAMLVIAVEDEVTHQLLSWHPERIAMGNAPYWQQTLFYNYSIPSSGLVSIYPWNNDAVQTVWFDELELTLSSGAGVPVAGLTGMSDYYPHGSIIPGRNYTGSYSYRYSYQGQFAEKDPETNKNSFQLRQYDALLGRWMAPDPLNQHPSPYLSMSNNPINFIDPSGGDDGWVPDGCGGYTYDSNPNVGVATVEWKSGGGTWVGGANGEITGFFNLRPVEVGSDYAHFYQKPWYKSLVKSGDNFNEGIRRTIEDIGDGKFDKVLRQMTAYGPGGMVAPGGAGTGTVAGRVFWCGGDEAMALANAHAMSTGRITLGMTRAGRNLVRLIETRNIPWSEAKPMWERLSRIYAKGAQGEVHFIGTEYPGSIWMEVEKPILINNGVSIIYY